MLLHSELREVLKDLQCSKMKVGQWHLKQNETYFAF